MTHADSATVRDPAFAHSARGKLLQATNDGVVFQPRGTTYELHLRTSTPGGAVGESVEAVIRVKARKMYTVPSGGNFVAPIFGSPRIFQGRVLDILQGFEGGPQRMVLKAGVIVVVEVPVESHAIDLGAGPIQIGSMVNVVAEPGTTFTPVGEM